MNFRTQCISFLAVALMALPIVVCAFVPQLPIWLAILVGAVIGGPVLVIGTRVMQDSTNHTANAMEPSPGAKKFWPTQTEKWGILALAIFLASAMVPILFFIPFILLLQANDSWTIAIVRTVLFAFGVVGARYWLEFAKNEIPNFFRGKLSDEALDSFMKQPTPETPRTAMQAAFFNWHLLLFAAVALLVVWGIVNVNQLGLNPPNPNAGGRRFRGFVRVLVWCQGNPNTMKSLSALVSVASLVLYGVRVGRASTQSTRLSSQISDVNSSDLI